MKKKMASRTRLKKRFDNLNNKRNSLIESNTGQSCELNQDLNTAIHRQPLSLESVPLFTPFKLGVFFITRSLFYLFLLAGQNNSEKYIKTSLFCLKEKFNFILSASPFD